MEAKVVYPFRDKFDENKKVYRKGDTFKGTKERVASLIAKGFLKDESKQLTPKEDEPEKLVKEKEQEQDGPVHVGGGYYELPNGEKVKGKANAQEAFEALKNE